MDDDPTCLYNNKSARTIEMETWLIGKKLWTLKTNENVAEIYGQNRTPLKSI